ncbi:MAG: 6-phosphogluconolactonase [Pyrinomonadaceae bacterium]|nr:6-phosphogluconolactonase [Pyrinomonadaceae bacterium]
MSSPARKKIIRRVVGDNLWLGLDGESDQPDLVARLPVQAVDPEILETEDAVAQAQFDEIQKCAAATAEDVVLVLLGGRGAQALYRLIRGLAENATIDPLLRRLHVFTQDALAPMRMSNGLSFVRDFERLLGDEFFNKVKSFTPMRTDTDDLEAELVHYIGKIESLGGIDICLLGLGPEAGAASHLAYIKPGSGATATDVAGLIPISSSILEHHVAKFKVGGSTITEADEAECRKATHILTLGPAAILGAKRVVQSVVDAATAPGKRASYRRVMETEIADDPETRAEQLNQNPGLWLRLHPNVRSLILPDVLGS